MKNLLKSLVLLVAVGLQFSFWAPGYDKLDCTMLHNGTFSYTDDEEDVIVTIDSENYNEYFNDKKYVVESKIKWVNDCEFNATVTKATLPNFPFKSGTVLNVKVESIEGNFVYYTGTIMGQSFKGALKKQATEGTNNK